MHACVLICEHECVCLPLLCCHANMVSMSGCRSVLAWPHIAYKLIRAEQKGQIYEFSLHCSLFLSLLLSVRPAACLLPVCLVPRLRFQNFLLQATFRAVSVLCERVCMHACVCVSLCNFLLSLSAFLTPPQPHFSEHCFSGAALCLLCMYVLLFLSIFSSRFVS